MKLSKHSMYNTPEDTAQNIALSRAFDLLRKPQLWRICYNFIEVL